MPDSKSIKSCVLLFLIVALLWRIKTSLNKLIYSDDVTIYRTEDVSKMPFPSMTMCLVPNDTAKDNWPKAFGVVDTITQPVFKIITEVQTGTHRDM